MDSLEYPVMCFMEDGTFYTYDTVEKLRTCREKNVDNGWYDKMIIVDSAGSFRQTVAVRKIRTLPFSWRNLLLGPLVEVDFDHEEDTHLVTVEQIIGMMRAASISWHGLESRTDFDELEERIAQSRNARELIQLFSD